MSVPPHEASAATLKPGPAEPAVVDTGEFLELYEAHARPLLAWLSARVTRSDLDDVHQEIWTKVWAKMRQSFKGGNFRAWLFTVARNHLMDRREKKPATPLMSDPEAPQVDATQLTPCTIVIDRERHESLTRCLAQLTEPQRRVVEMRLAGDDYESISEALHITSAQAHSHFFTAKKKLRELLDEA